MARKPVKRTIIPLDPAFFIPEGVDEFVYDSQIVFEGEAEPTEEQLEDVYLVEAEDTVEEEEIFLDPPDNVTIVAQEIITAPGGQQYVNVIIEFEDVEGAETYEPRVSLT